MAVTASAMEKDRERAQREGFAAYLTKPLDVDRFLAVVDEILGLVRTAWVVEDG